MEANFGKLNLEIRAWVRTERKPRSSEAPKLRSPTSYNAHQPQSYVALIPLRFLPKSDF